ncbi:MAG: TonB-dependent receptor [Deltaproteobacteria bacterium]|nr:TonB-dependent receptor [Deltaproteobacteria bacterium]
MRNATDTHRPLLLAVLALALLPARAAWAADGQRVEGLLVHKATGEPVIGAPVQLDEGGFAVSDEAGRFRFEDVRPGRHRLTVNDPECAPFDAGFSVRAGEVTRLRYALDPPGEQDVEEVIIRSRRLEEEVSDTVLEMDEVQRIPGTQGDVLKIVQSLPGVARNLAVGGTGAGIVVRGAAPEDSRVLIDGFEVPMLYHFGGLKSVFNSDMLKRIDFLPGGFGAEYGQAIGGIVDVQTQPCTHKQLDGYVELSMLDSGFFVRGPINDEIGFFAAARRSTVDLWLPHVLPDEPGFEMTVAPVYYDYQAKVDWSLSADDRLSFMAFGSYDELKFLLAKPPSGDPSMRGDFGMVTSFHRIQAGWKHAPQNAGWNLSMSLIGGYTEAKVDVGEMYLDLVVPNTAARADWEWEITERWKLGAGVQTGYVYFDLAHRIPHPPKEGEVPSRLQNFSLNEGTESQQAWVNALYTCASWKPIDELRVTGGLRFDAVLSGDVRAWAIMPRLSFKYELRAGTVLKGGAGLYYQMPTEDELSSNFGNPELDMERAWHFTLGVEQQLPLQVLLDFTVFYKTLDQLVVSDPDTNYANDGIGKVAGIEILVRRDLADGVFGWLAYTLMRSARRDRTGEPWRLFDFDQTHILTLVAGLRLPQGPAKPAHGLADGWEFGLRFQLVSGNPATPILGGIYDADYDNYLPVPGAINSERLPLYHRLDLRVDYTWAFESWALSLYLDVQNVYDYRSVEGVRYNYDYTDRAYFEGLPILPALGVKGSF